MNTGKTIVMVAALAVALLTQALCPAYAQEKSRYMGGDVTLTKAPNGAIVNAEVLEVNSKIVYHKPTTDKVADGVWCIGGYSVGNTSVIEGDDGIGQKENGFGEIGVRYQR